MPDERLSEIEARLKAATPLVQEVIECPECYQSCDWCSGFRFQVRKVGCMNMFGKHRCHKHKERGEKCGTCDGSHHVTVRREIIAPNVTALRGSNAP